MLSANIPSAVYVAEIIFSESVLRGCPANGLASFLAHELAHLEERLKNVGENKKEHWTIDVRAAETTSLECVFFGLRWMYAEFNGLRQKYPWSFRIYEWAGKVSGNFWMFQGDLRKVFKELNEQMALLEKSAEKEGRDEHQTDDSTDGQRAGSVPVESSCSGAVS